MNYPRTYPVDWWGGPKIFICPSLGETKRICSRRVVFYTCLEPCPLNKSTCRHILTHQLKPKTVNAHPQAGIILETWTSNQKWTVVRLPTESEAD